MIQIEFNLVQVKSFIIDFGLYKCRYRQADRVCKVALASSTTSQALQAGLGSLVAADFAPSKFAQLLQVLLLRRSTSVPTCKLCLSACCALLVRIRLQSDIASWYCHVVFTLVFTPVSGLVFGLAISLAFQLVSRLVFSLVFRLASMQQGC